MDIADKALLVYLEPNNPDKPGKYLKRGEGYNTDGKLLTILSSDVEPGDKIQIHAHIGETLSEDEYRNLLCDPNTWRYKSDNLYCTANLIISMFNRDMALYREGITETPDPKFDICMLDSVLLLMAFAIENAAKGIIVYSTIKKDPSLKATATLEKFEIRGHDVVGFLRRAFKAKNEKLEFMELRLAEDLAAYAVIKIASNCIFPIL